MRKLLAAAITLLLFATTACDSLEERFVFYINERESFTVTPAMPAGETIELEQDTIFTFADSTFQQNRTRAELVQEIVLDKYRISIAGSTDDDLDFLQSVDVFISADTLEEVRVAFLEDVPVNEAILKFATNLNLTNANLDDYLKQERYYIHTHVRLRKKVKRDVNMATTVRFRATADPL